MKSEVCDRRLVCEVPGTSRSDRTGEHRGISRTPSLGAVQGERSPSSRNNPEPGIVDGGRETLGTL